MFMILVPMMIRMVIITTMVVMITMIIITNTVMITRMITIPVMEMIKMTIMITQADAGSELPVRRPRARGRSQSVGVRGRPCRRCSEGIRTPRVACAASCTAGS